MRTSLLAVAVCMLVLAAESASREGDAGRVSSGPPMLTPRAAHTATTLQDGRVLIAGGCTLDSCESGPADATAEAYDPGMQAVLPTGRMAAPRNSHVAALLPDGRVLVAGGWSGNEVVATSEIYDPLLGRFYPGPSMNEPRAGMTATTLPDGRVLVAGGSGGGGRFTASTEIYDPATNRFSPGPAMAHRRVAHAAARLAESAVLIAGGSDREGSVLRSAEVIDVARGSRCDVGDLAVPRHKLAATALPSGDVLVVGGSDARDFRGRHSTTEIFDVSTRGFRAGPAMADSRFKIPTGVAQADGGRIVIAGGAPSVEVLAPGASDLAVAIGDVGGAWMFSTVTALRDGRVLIAGGYDERIRLTAQTWLYAPPTGAAPPVARTAVQRVCDSRIELLTTSLRARGKGSVTLRLRSSSVLRDVKLSLVRRDARTIARGSRSQLSGTTPVRLRLTRAMRPGSYRLRLRAPGLTGELSFPLRVRRTARAR